MKKAGNRFKVSQKKPVTSKKITSNFIIKKKITVYDSDILKIKNNTTNDKKEQKNKKNQKLIVNEKINFDEKNEAEIIKFFKKNNEFSDKNIKKAEKNNKPPENSNVDKRNSIKKSEFKNLTKRRLNRMANISIIYSWQLFNQNIDIEEIKEKYFELTIDQLKLLNFIQKNYSFLKKVISLQLKSNWSWERILPLIRSILLVGAAELFFIPKRIVFNESIEITKIFSVTGDNEFCFVNAVLQKIYNYYETKNLLRN
ncbi:transcription antitermination protein NusB [Mesomycoplasma flocculare]|uniref:Transcription anti-termination factor NusB n=2 Tax=Mesomycoplasma flocculare TaxID=2128 RepID=A0A0A8E8N3_MESFC|nr:transcription antitermination protein NusB [Mesomycoplasma flocculare]AJC49967.1 transcription anti-termination factor NusB [Mesomycoplasma flocculare ATCC 27399]